METIASIGRWLLIESVYGVAILACVAFVLALVAKKVIPKFPSPYIVAAVAFLIALATVPSVPRYEFERKAMSQIESKDWIRVINRTKWGSLTEPLTWFHAPVGAILLAMPNNPMEGGYREVLMRYEEEPRIRMVEPDCTDRTIIYAQPDDEGIVRYTSSTAKPMDKQEISVYCEYDWKVEKEALRAAMLKGLESN